MSNRPGLPESPYLRLTTFARCEQPAHGFVEGRDGLIPFRVDYPSVDGGVVHFWLAGRPFPGRDGWAVLGWGAFLDDLCRVTTRKIDAVAFTYSDGTPPSMETHILVKR